MARLAIISSRGMNSEEEFPEMGDLLRGVKGTATTTRMIGEQVETASKSNNKGKSVVAMRGENMPIDEKSRLVEKSPVKKKRVLVKRGDNPLLRRIESDVKERSLRRRDGTGADGESGVKADVGIGWKAKVVLKREEVGGVGDGVGDLDEELVENAVGYEIGEKPSERRGRSLAVDENKILIELEKRRAGDGKGKIGLFEDLRADNTQERPENGKATEPPRKCRVNVGLAKLGSKEVVLEHEERTKECPVPKVRPISRTGKSKISAIINLDSDDEASGHGTSPAPIPRRSRKHRDAPPKTKSKFILTDTEEEDSSEDEHSSGMSDFIVSDNEPLEDEDGDDDSVFEVAPPVTKSARKLFRGRRPRFEDSENEGSLGDRMEKLKVDDENEDVFGGKEAKKNALLDKIPTANPKLPSKANKSMVPPAKTKQKEPLPSSDIEDPFTLRFSPSENNRKVTKITQLTTPPGSPKLLPIHLPSPSKLPRIPTSPHRQSSDAFWSQSEVNDWNDTYSPRKAPTTSLKTIKTPSGTVLFSPQKSPTKTTRLTKDSKKAFAQIKHSLAESFLAELDLKITSGKIAEMAASTGGIRIIWSKKLNTTAGRANWKRETIRSKTEPSPTFKHYASIELAEKVIDDSDRLLNVIAHEFCHLANFMISNIRTNPHGKEFKVWARKCSEIFGDRGIEVTTKHTYEIEYKYIWECENCGTEFKRHSRSIDVVKHRCGVCKALLVQIKPVPKTGKLGAGLTGYQVFVKENVGRIREEMGVGSPQKAVMIEVGRRYQESKTKSLVDETEVGNKQGTLDDELGGVVRKLDFLDLTSP